MDSNLVDLETHECILTSTPDDSDTNDSWSTFQEALQEITYKKSCTVSVFRLISADTAI